MTDQLEDLLFTPSEDGDGNLRREGIPAEKIHRVGNVMIDTLVRLLPATEDYGNCDEALNAADLITRIICRMQFHKSFRGHD